MWGLARGYMGFMWGLGGNREGSCGFMDGSYGVYGWFAWSFTVLSRV